MKVYAFTIDCVLLIGEKQKVNFFFLPEENYAIHKALLCGQYLEDVPLHNSYVALPNLLL